MKKLFGSRKRRKEKLKKRLQRRRHCDDRRRMRNLLGWRRSLCMPPVRLAT
jgi:hypothetical protein